MPRLAGHFLALHMEQKHFNSKVGMVLQQHFGLGIELRVRVLRVPVLLPVGAVVVLDEHGKRRLPHLGGLGPHDALQMDHEWRCATRLAGGLFSSRDQTGGHRCMYVEAAGSCHLW